MAGQARKELLPKPVPIREEPFWLGAYKGETAAQLRARGFTEYAIKKIGAK